MVVGRPGSIKRKSGERTLLASVALSAPGPIAVGLGLLLGQSSTQLADFIRRTAELAAMIVSLIVFRVTHKEGAKCAPNKAKLERIANVCTGVVMCLSGAVILLLALLSYGEKKGNVIPGLVIAILGAITNTFFWLKYRALNSVTPNAILALQSNLYRSKFIVDTCVTLALTAIVVSPESTVALFVEAAGSVFVSVYLFVVGTVTALGKQRGAL